ncbi:hypothetical protein CC79DRAFT_1399194 [Sarocladium strictum]
MTSQRTARKLPHAASFPTRRRSARRSTQPSRPSSSFDAVAIKPDPPALNSSSSMSADFADHNGSASTNHSSNYGGGDRHAVGQLQTPQHNASYPVFESPPVDLTGATMLSQSEYHNLTNNAPQTGLNSYRLNQSNGETSQNTSFNLSTPQPNPFTSSIGAQTPSHQTVSSEEHIRHVPIPRPPFPGYMPRQTAAQVVHTVRSHNFRIDGAVCKKLASEPALREPEQRNSDRILNVGRRGNAEALLCQIAGQEAIHSCKNCKRGHGPWTKCVVYPGLFYGSCSNCWFNASGARCTFQESNHHPLHHIYASMAPSYNNPFPVPPPGLPYGPTGPVTHHTTPPSLAPPYGHETPASASRSREGISMQGVQFRRSVGMSNGDDGGYVSGSTHPADVQVISSNAVREITEGMIGDSVTWGARARFLVRIQAAASELGMRLGEYDEFLVKNNLQPDENYPYRGRQSSLHDEDEDEADDDGTHHIGNGSHSSFADSHTGKHGVDTSGSEDAEDFHHNRDGALELDDAPMA